MADKHQLLVKVQKLLIQLQDPDPKQRIEACEELRQLPSIPDHALKALRDATQDPNGEVADAAQRALSSHASGTINSPTDLTPTTGRSDPEGDQSSLKSSSRPVHPWFKIWIKPRGTIREIIDYDPTYLVIPLALIAGLAETLRRAMNRDMGERYELGALVLIILIVGPLAGVVSVYIGGALFSWLGKLLGGKGSPKEVRAAMAWSSIPWMLILLIDLSRLAMFGSEEFTFATPRLDAFFESTSTWALLYVLYFFMTIFVGIAIYLWSAILSIKCLAEAHRFSAWRSIATILIPFTVGLVVAIIIIFII